MIFKETPLAGAYVIEEERIEDERGYFTRTYCEREFEAHGLHIDWVQSNTSYNKSRGTLRGMHMQLAPHEEPKIVECTSGAAFDVIVDMRRDSKTFLEYTAVVLSDANRRKLYVPPGFAHGFLTLVADTELSYRMGEFYYPDSAVGIRWNDPALNIKWPFTPALMSEKDASLPDLQPNSHTYAS